MLNKIRTLPERYLSLVLIPVFCFHYQECKTCLITVLIMYLASCYHGTTTYGIYTWTCALCLNVLANTELQPAPEWKTLVNRGMTTDELIRSTWSHLDVTDIILWRHNRFKTETSVALFWMWFHLLSTLISILVYNLSIRGLGKLTWNLRDFQWLSSGNVLGDSSQCELDV